LQVARLEQRVLAVSSECEALSAALDEARSAADGARSAAHAALEGLGQQPRERWPRSVLLVVQAAEVAVREEAAQKAVSAGETICMHYRVDSTAQLLVVCSVCSC
jgi:hypothetical protein